jgi:hypothetical protein
MTPKTEKAVLEERMRCYEILHKYTMKTTSYAALYLLEAAQKEILS